MQPRILGSLKSGLEYVVHAVKINRSIGWGDITLKKHHSYKKSEAEEALWTEVFTKFWCSRWQVSPARVMERPWVGGGGVGGGRGGCPIPPRALLHMRRDFPTAGGLLILTPSPPAPEPRRQAGGYNKSAKGVYPWKFKGPLYGGPRMCPRSGHPGEPAGGGGVPSIWHPCASQHWGGGHRM